MPSLIDLRRRIRTVKSTQQITRAMKMVAAARLRRAQDRILAARPYALELRKVIGHMASRIGDEGHPLLAERDRKRVLLAVVTGDKGLCGSFNSNVLRHSERTLKGMEDVGLLLLGKKGAEYFKRRRWPIRASHRSLFSNVRYEAAKEIADDVIGAFVAGEYDAVHIVYNQFVSVMTQKLTIDQLLPLAGLGEGAATEAAARGGAAEYLYEPSAAEILEELLPSFVVVQIYRVLLESQAAEHGARMTAMDAATKNASELIDKLTMTYNRSRQAAITKELIEVVSGAAALEG